MSDDYWGGSYWADNYWADTYWSLGWEAIVAVTPECRGMAIEFEDRGMAIEGCEDEL
jgi:hypothetical protein